MLSDRLSVQLDTLKAQGLYRQRNMFVAHPNVVQFSGNDYLSLGHDRLLNRAFARGFDLCSVGSSGSMLISGYHPSHLQLEAAFSAALGTEDCLLFTSGYVANLSVMNLLSHIGAIVLLDKAVHASIYDGLKYSAVSYVRYRHQDMKDLVQKIGNAPEHALLLTEGIFSMSGYLPPLDQIQALLQAKNLNLIVDEAHAFGIIGKDGLGATHHAGLSQQQVPLRVIPLGKAFACFGAIVAGQRLWIDALLQISRAFIYSTAISPACAYGMIETLNIVRSADDRRRKLNDLVAYFKQKVTRSHLQWRESHTPIQQLQLGCPHLSMKLSAQLRAANIVCVAIRQPTVPKLEVGLRVILNAHHQPEDIDNLFHHLHRLVK